MYLVEGIYENIPQLLYQHSYRSVEHRLFVEMVDQSKKLYFLFFHKLKRKSNTYHPSEFEAQSQSNYLHSTDFEHRTQGV